MLFKIDADYDTVEWYGNGPAETYWDRQHGAKLGIYQNKVADNMAQYLVPQECGAKTAVRWAKVVDRKGRGLLFTADAAKPMFFSALPYTPHEMESAKHPYELPPVQLFYKFGGICDKGYHGMRRASRWFCKFY